MITAGHHAPLKRFDAPMLRGKQVHYLLDLTWAGQTFHLSREVLEVPTLYGNAGGAGVLQYDGSLEDGVEWEEAISLFSSSADVASIKVNVVLPVNVPSLISQGFDLLQAVGELSMWVEGTNYEARRVLLRGRLTDPEYGWEGDPVNASLQSEFFEDRAILPTAAEMITSSTWPDSPDDSQGLAYPVVFGGQAPASGAVTLSPAYCVADSLGNEAFLVAGHLCGDGNVRVSNGDNLTTLALLTDTDSLGHQVTLVDVVKQLPSRWVGTLGPSTNITGNGLANDSLNVYIVVAGVATGPLSPIVVLAGASTGATVAQALENAIQGGGGDYATVQVVYVQIPGTLDYRYVVSNGTTDPADTIYCTADGASTLADDLNLLSANGATAGTAIFEVTDSLFIVWDQNTTALQFNGEGLSGAGDVLNYFFGRSTLQVDSGRMAAARPYLNRFQLSACILEGVSPFDFCVSNLSAILPMSVVTGPFGVYVIPWRYDATGRDAVDRLDVGIDPSLCIEGPVAYSGGMKDVVNDFQLRYNLSQRLGSTRDTLRLSGQRDAADGDSLENVYCRQSQLRYGVRTMDEESTVVRDSNTAGLVLGWWSRSKALLSRTVSYSAGYDRAWLERGDVVTITDPNLFLVDQVALVEGIVYREDATLLITLRIVENVAQTLHPAGV